MKPILFIAFLFNVLTAIAQNTPAEKLIISYARGGNSWGVPGIYSRRETIELMRDGAIWTIAHQYKITENVANDSLTRLKDSVAIATKRYHPIAVAKINELLSQLNTNNEKEFNAAYLRPLLKRPTQKGIITIARQYDKLYKVEDEEGINKEAIQRIMNFDKLDAFLQRKKPNTEFENIIIDRYDHFKIYHIIGADTTCYKGNCFELPGQPIVRYNKGANDTIIINLEVNRLLEEILPKNFILKRKIAVNNITDLYVAWYLYQGL